MTNEKYDPRRPQDALVVSVVADYFRVHPSVAIMWLTQLDLREVTNLIADNEGELPLLAHGRKLPVTSLVEAVSRELRPGGLLR